MFNIFYSIIIPYFFDLIILQQIFGILLFKNEHCVKLRLLDPISLIATFKCNNTWLVHRLMLRRMTCAITRLKCYQPFICDRCLKWHPVMTIKVDGKSRRGKVTRNQKMNVTRSRFKIFFFLLSRLNASVPVLRRQAFWLANWLRSPWMLANLVTHPCPSMSAWWTSITIQFLSKQLRKLKDCTNAATFPRGASNTQSKLTKVVWPSRTVRSAFTFQLPPIPAKSRCLDQALKRESNLTLQLILTSMLVMLDQVS